VSTLRDRILSSNDIQSEMVNIPQWGVDVEVRGMTGAARAAMVQEAATADGNVNYAKIMPDLVIQCTFDPDTGLPLFTPADRDAIMSKSGAALENINKVAMRLSGFGAEELDKAGKDS
jgi:hypothetical protein